MWIENLKRLPGDEKTGSAFHRWIKAGDCRGGCLLMEKAQTGMTVPRQVIE
ncbi:MAG: hypothetical protein GXO78_12960 [Calditrichaeota bacterium]|nr:hypothetical protein [Calditrichota bacterium]